MRYSNILHTARRHNVLKNRRKSSLISWIWVIAVLVVLSLVVNFSSLDSQELASGFISSLIRITIAYVIAVVLAVLIALLVTTNKVAEDILLPVLDVLQSFPSFALFPLLVVTLRNSPEVIVISVLTITVIWPILFSIIGGVKNRREDWEEAATIFGARGIKRLFYFILPQLWPAIITGSIVGWGEGWEFIIGAELLVKINVGIGTYLGALGARQENLALAYGITILLVLLFVINKLIWLPLLDKATAYSSEA